MQAAIAGQYVPHARQERLASLPVSPRQLDLREEIEQSDAHCKRFGSLLESVAATSGGLSEATLKQMDAREFGVRAVQRIGVPRLPAARQRLAGLQRTGDRLPLERVQHGAGEVQLTFQPDVRARAQERFPHTEVGRCLVQPARSDLLFGDDAVELRSGVRMSRVRGRALTLIHEPGGVGGRQPVGHAREHVQQYPGCQLSVVNPLSGRARLPKQLRAALDESVVKGRARQNGQAARVCDAGAVGCPQPG